MGEQRTAVCVMGMSRSGTSLTARLLSQGGVYLGPEREMLWHRPSNADGHWENWPMMRLNEWLLRSRGGSWQAPPPLPAGWERSEALAAERCAARRYVERTFGGRGLWGWKDPRNCLTGPFWRQLIPDLRYVICLRNPLDVAASLERREGFDTGASLRLWLEYLSAAFANTEGSPRIFVAYEDYFDPRRSPVERLLRFAGLRPPPPGSERARRVEATIKDRLRHHRAPAETLAGDPRVPAELVAAYDRLSRLAASPARSPARGETP